MDKKLLRAPPQPPGCLADHVEVYRRTVVAGNPGCGKSQWVSMFINRVVRWDIDNLVVCAQTYDTDAVYQDLKQTARKRGVKGLFSNSLDCLCSTCQGPQDDKQEEDDAPAAPCDKLHLFDFPANERSCLVIDDMISRSAKEMSKLLHFWACGRRQQLTCIVVSQNETSVPVAIRRCCEYRVLKSCGITDGDLERLLRSLTASCNVDKIMGLWRKICAITWMNPKTGRREVDRRQFLFIDHTHPDPSYRWRHNFQRTVIEGLV